MELCSDDDVEKALGHNNENMGWRYVEVFRSMRSQMDWDLSRDENEGQGAGVVRLRGLPYGSTEVQIKTFLSGLSSLLQCTIHVCMLKDRLEVRVHLLFLPRLPPTLL